MTKVRDITELLEKIAPASLADTGDNSGFIVGDLDREVNTVLLALDITKDVASEAIDLGAELIISHHPLIYLPIKNMLSSTPTGKILLSLASKNISVYAAHTTLDSSDKGVNAMLAEELGLINVERFGFSDWQGGRIGQFPHPITLGELANMLSYITQEEHIGIVGDTNRPIEKIAFVSGGAGDINYIDEAIKRGADCYISCDFRHHVYIYASQMDFCLAVCQHYSMERTVLKHLKNEIDKEMGSKVKTLISQREKSPLKIL